MCWSRSVTSSLCRSGYRSGQGLPAKNWLRRDVKADYFWQRIPTLWSHLGMWKQWILWSLLLQGFKGGLADGINSSSGYFIPQLNLLSICACVSSLICIPALCSHFLFAFIFPKLPYYVVPTTQYPTKSIEMERWNLCHAQANENISGSVGRGVTVWMRKFKSRLFKSRLKRLSLQVLSAGCRIVKMSYLN